VIIDNAFPLIDWYAAADVIITDYSGAAVEAAAACVASYYYIYDADEYIKRRGLNVDLRNEAVGKYAFKDADALAKQVFQDFASKGEIRYDKIRYDYQALSGFAGKYLEVPLEGNTQRLASFIMINL
jgi:CDP-glycerol glycerophosphotransferase (TagB/SpsB family)